MDSFIRRFALSGALVCLGGAVASAALFDHDAFNTILRNYVDADGYVDYSGIRDNSASALDSYIERLGEADLSGWPQDERVSF